MNANGFASLSQTLPYWPSDLLGQPEVLDEVGVRDFQVREGDNLLSVAGTVLWFREIVFDVPGLDGLSVALLSEGNFTAAPFVFDVLPDLAIRLPRLSLTFRFASDLLLPVQRVNDRWEVRRDSAGKPRPLELGLENVGIAVNLSTGDIEVVTPAGAPQLSLGAVQIGDTGVVLEIEAVSLYLSSAQTAPPAAPPGFRGVAIDSLKVHLPQDLDVPLAPSDLEFEHLYIGSGGLSGTIRGAWNPTFDAASQSYLGNGGGTLFGLSFGLRSLEVTFQQSVPTASALRGEMLLPFFERPLGVDLALGLNGFTVALSAVQPPGSTYQGGLVTLEKENILRLELDSIGFAVTDGVFSVTLSGTLTPLFGAPGLNWPSFGIKALTIDSEGNVSLDGGWLDLPEHYTLDFYGFQITIAKLGFGKTEDGGKWIGFSGALKLVDGLSAGASVEGLRITWFDDPRPTRVTLEGVGVEFEIPAVLSFKGAVSYRELDVAGEKVHRFDGDISLELISLGLEVDATLVIGTATGPEGPYTFFAIHLGAELPAGIPLWSTGLALYGMAGLFALQMEPDKHEAEPWYGMGPEEGWYKRPEIGVTDLHNKWVNRRGSSALGAGVTLGTVADNGYTFSGKLLLLLVFPGPILMLEGKANILRERSRLDEEPIFRAIAVLDGRAGTFLVGLDAQYRFGEGGELIDIQGGVEAFFSLADAGAWHLYLGQREPRDRRVRAEVLNLFEANAYFMLDARQVAFGAWVGLAMDWDFGPVGIVLEAWMEGNAILSWRPIFLHGDLWLHGKVAVRIFFFELGLSVDARFAADVFDPFHLLAELSIGVILPWPFPDFDVSVTLEWGPEPIPPLLPLPLKEVAVEHLKVTTSWPLPRKLRNPSPPPSFLASPRLLLPDYDADSDGLRDDADRDGVPDAPPGPEEPADLSAVPVVPLDSRPHLTFSRPINDDAGVGINGQPVVPEWERIGDPSKNEGPVEVRYALTEVALERRLGGAWSTVARRAATANPAGVPTLFGSWALIPQMPDGGGENVGQVKLWLWSKTPFDYTRRTNHAWDEWFTERFDDYPCIPAAPDRIVCCDFEDRTPGEPIALPWRSQETPDIVLSGQPIGTVTALSPPVEGNHRALCFEARSGVDVLFPRPVRAARVVIVTPPAQDRRSCVDFAGQRAGSGPNPRDEENLHFEILDRAGNLLPRSRVTQLAGQTGLSCGSTLSIVLPCLASSVELTLVHSARPAEVEAFHADGTVAGRASMTAPRRVPETLRIEADGITRLVVTAKEQETILLEICYACPESCTTTALAYDVTGAVIGRFEARDSRLVAEAPEMAHLYITGKCHFCIVQVCANLGPDPAEVTMREEMAQHLVEELARLHAEGEVLEPFTLYRLRIVTEIRARGMDVLAGYTLAPPAGQQTEYAYFRTEGPPGLTRLLPPVGHPNPAEFDSGLDDLTRYVRQTVPATVPATGEKPPLPRPVYRAYDVGVEFNEDYVDLLYRRAGRDLGLYLYDNNNLPVRDAEGRLLVLSNRWGVTETLTLDESVDRWVRLINGSRCVALDPELIPHDRTLTSADPGQVLDPDTVYEARLAPLLMHEDFSGDLSGWTVHEEGANQTPPRWATGSEGTPPSYFVEQRSNLWGGSLRGSDPVKPGTLLLRADDPRLPAGHPDQPGRWTDYRVSVILRSTDDDAMGLVFRQVNARNHYRFSMDRERRYRRLTRVVDGVHVVLAEDAFVYQVGQDYLLTVEALGDSLRVYLDGAPVFAVRDGALDRGGIGLYCWANDGFRAADVRVDDLRQGVPVVYRFKFTTSRFAHFFHLLHSYQDETWQVDLAAGAASDAELSALASAAVPAADALSDAEARSYEMLAGSVLGQAARQSPLQVEATSITRDGEIFALLVRSPEPMDWSRTSLEVLHSDRSLPPAAPPGRLKLTDVSWGATQPNEETVSLLLREATDMSDVRVEQRRLPGPLLEPAGDPRLFVDRFDGPPGGLLFEEDFGPNALDHYTIVDQGTYLGPSAWAVSGGHIVQASNLFGGSIGGADPAMPGTLALTGPATWANVRIRATLRSTDDDVIGVVFRYQDGDNTYRFSMDRQRASRRLVKRAGGVTTVLWQDSVVYDMGRSYALRIEAFGDHLLGYLDEALLFSVEDGDLAAGRAGFYAWLNTGAHFEALSVEALEAAVLLWQPAFAERSELTLVDEAGAIQGPSDWRVLGGALVQSSNIHVVEITPHRPGSYALFGSAEWRDVTVSVRLRSEDNDGIGVMFRYQDGDNYYRFSMDRQNRFRRLVKKVGGAVTTLWEDGVPFAQGQTYELTLIADGEALRGHLDGALLFAVRDPDLRRGRVGLYVWANDGARFERLVVTERTRRVGRWTIRDTDPINVPSVWRLSGGALLQSAAAGGGAPPAAPGTQVVAGDAAWTDYRLTARMRSDAGDAIGVVFRYRDEENYYRLSLDGRRNTRRLVRQENGVFTTLWSEANGLPLGAAFTLTVDAIGPRLAGYLDGQHLFEVSDDRLPAGQVGLYCWGNNRARFERVEVSRPPLDAYALLRDRFRSGSTAGWAFVDEGSAQGPAAWATFDGTLRQTSNVHTPPATRAALAKRGTHAIAGDATWRDLVLTVWLQSNDDDAIGVMFRYQDANHYYRFSMNRELRYRRLVSNVGGVFTQLWEDGFAYEVGRSYELTLVLMGASLRGFMDGIPLFAVEDTALAIGRIGLYCWRNTDARFSRVSVYPADRAFADWLLDEPFQSLSPGRWTVVDEGDQEGPSRWRIIGGEMRQTSNLYGGDVDPAAADKPGTCALAGDGSWTDYRVITRLRSDDDDAIGVVFRHQDVDNYYRFSMDRQRAYRRLVKKVGGLVTVLWEDSVPFVLRRAYVLTLECLGARLTGYLDGVPIFSVEDGDLSSGRVGLYCWANTGARFSELRVAGAAWTPYYCFGPEPRLPAGARIRLHAGNATAAFAAEPNVAVRFLAGLDEQGQIHLPSSGADLRIREPGAPAGHERCFLPDSARAPVAARVLRKVDGTGFFLIVPASGAVGSRLAPGAYRLRLSYRRDNRAAVAGSQVLSQAGDTGPEVVTVDVPVG